MKWAKREKRSCLNCTIEFEILLSPSRSGRGKYCSRSCSAKANSPTHGHHKSRTYSSYYAMLARCTNPRNAKYYVYGAVGVTVCAHWRESFENFLADMGERPLGKTLDRIAGAQEYGPRTCRWAAPTEQQRNLKNNVQLTFEGRTQCMSAWARETGIDNDTLRTRLKRGWSLEQALTVKPKLGNRIRKKEDEIAFI